MPPRLLSRRALLVVGGLVAAAAVAAAVVVSAGDDPSPPVEVQVLALNDFHGNLEPPSGSGGRIDGVDAGGAEFVTATGEPLLAPYAVRDVQGVRIGFIGMTLEGTPTS